VRGRSIVALALRGGADQLLEIERVALGQPHEPLDERRLRAIAEHVAHEPLAGLLAELLERELLERPLRPDPGEQLVHLGARQREDEEGAVAQIAQRGVEELHGGEIAPVQILEHEQHGAGGGLGAEQLDERLAHPRAEELRVLARRAERQAVLVRKRRPDELAEELRAA